ncbi:MAG TPA: MBL fold metallo-hydrolase [Vicinamibacterales bacterium]|nr:MBL fold metallo-hydrolase [Vicinamibacterales bacterium]
MKTLMAGLLVFAGIVAAQTRPAPARIQVADGIYLYRTAPYGEVGLDGNSIAVIENDGVLVFDTNGTPAAAAAVLADIKTLTSQPVRYIVNSHWHWDHWYGTEIYTKAFPDVKVIAHEKTKVMMAGPAIDFNKPGLEQQLPVYLSQLEQRIAKAEAATPPAANLAQLKQAFADGKYFLEQKAGVHHTLPNQTYTDKLTLKLGNREIQVLHHDRAITPGDSFLYLPKEKIVIAGDLLINPVTYALSSYPTGWIKTLEYIDSLDASIIVPGHGEPLHDEKLLKATIAVLKDLQKRGAGAKARGLDPDAARAEIMPQIKDLMVAITGDQPNVNRAFEMQLVDWFLHRVYDELNGPLTDAIAPIPAK